MIKRPMLACSTTLTREQCNKLRFPVLASYKEDGIRCLLGCKDSKLQPFSRKLKVIPNVLIQQWAETEGIAGLDGELILPGHTFHEIQSYIMSAYPLTPQSFKYKVFDMYSTDPMDSYWRRLQRLQNKIDMYGPTNTEVLYQIKIYSANELWYYFEETLLEGKEGLIVRSPDGPYKQGRSTMREQYMLKMKHYEEGEAIIIDFVPEYTNQNEKTKDETGYAKRSSHQANCYAIERLGSLVCKDCKTGEVFSVGSGMDHSLKERIWQARTTYRRATLTYKWQVHGTKDKPRTPIFKGVRLD